jgi:hypothetical protein
MYKMYNYNDMQDIHNLSYHHKNLMDYKYTNYHSIFYSVMLYMINIAYSPSDMYNNILHNIDIYYYHPDIAIYHYYMLNYNFVYLSSNTHPHYTHYMISIGILYREMTSEMSCLCYHHIAHLSQNYYQ